MPVEYRVEARLRKTQSMAQAQSRKGKKVRIHQQAPDVDIYHHRKMGTLSGGALTDFLLDSGPVYMKYLEDPGQATAQAYYQRVDPFLFSQIVELPAWKNPVACRECGQSEAWDDYEDVIVCMACGLARKDDVPKNHLQLTWTESSHRRKKAPSPYQRIGYLKTILAKLKVDSQQHGYILKIFEQAEKAFERVRKCRKNFPSLPYFCFKVAQLRGWDALKQRCKLLKSAVKVRVLDGIWGDICRDRGWEYLPS